MDPFQEQRLRDEVIYLHSLWHQGPPTPNPNPYYPRNTYPNFNPNPYYFNPNPNNFNPNPNSFNPNPYYVNPHPNNCNPHPYISAQLQSSNANQVKKGNHIKLSNSTQFKKENRRGRGRRVDINRGNNGVTRQEPPPVSELVWPCNPDPPETIGWPVLNLKPAQTTREPTEEEKVRIFATQVQQKALKAAQEFFANNVDSDGDDNIESEDDDDDMTDDDGHENYKFFMEVVMDDSELRGYYEKNWESGEFSCLVCGGIGEKVGKRFKNLVALIQHSITIARTKKRQAHRAFGQAICKVLGWDINRLPVGVSAKTGDSQGNAIDDCSKVDQNAGNSANIDNREIVLNKNDNASDMLPNKESDLSNVVGSELMVCEHSLMTADCNKGVVDLDNGIASITEGKEEVVVTGLEPCKEDGAAGIDGNEVKDNNNDNGAMDRLKENVENLVIS